MALKLISNCAKKENRKKSSFRLKKMEKFAHLSPECDNERLDLDRVGWCGMFAHGRVNRTPEHWVGHIDSEEVVDLEARITLDLDERRRFPGVAIVVGAASKRQKARIATRHCERVRGR